MAIPDYQTIMLPLLRFLEDEKEHNIGEVVDSLAEKFNLSTEERQQLLGSGQQTVTNLSGSKVRYEHVAGYSDTPAGRRRIESARAASGYGAGPRAQSASCPQRFAPAGPRPCA